MTGRLALLDDAIHDILKSSFQPWAGLGTSATLTLDFSASFQRAWLPLAFDLSLLSLFSLFKGTSSDFGSHIHISFTYSLCIKAY